MGDTYSASDRRATELEIAVAILGPLAKEDIEKANKDGKEILNHYLWLLKEIDQFILFGDIYSDPPKLE